MLTSCTINRETIDKGCHCQKMNAWNVPLKQNELEYIQTLKKFRYQFDQPYYSDDMSYGIESNSNILYTIQDFKEFPASTDCACDCDTQKNSLRPVFNYSHDWLREGNRVSDIDVFLNSTYHTK